MKLDNDFKYEVDRSIKEADYIGSKIFLRVVFIICLIGFIGVGGTYTLGGLQKDAEREVFKHSVAYNENAAEFIAKSYREYNQAESDADKKAICEYVANRYPNLDYASIENGELRNFYMNCVEGRY